MDISEGYSNVDGGESSGLEMSLYEELGILAMKTPGVKKALEATNSRLRRSSRAKNPVQRFGYDNCIAQ